MKKKLLYLFITLIVILIFKIPAHSQRFDPHLEWREMNTGHFRIIYNSHLKDIAFEVAVLAEDIFPRLESFLNAHLTYQPAIVLIDHTDIPNGYSDPLQGEIHMVIAQPYDQFLGTRFRSWVQMVLYHELTHLLHIGAASQEILRWRNLLGYVVLPNIIQPMWAWEGYAIYVESKFGFGGRSTDTVYEMYLRDMALRDQFLPSYMLTGYSYLDNWPGQTGCYIYGASVCQFIAEQFGEEKLAAISTERSNNLNLYGFDKAVKKTLGINTEQLWALWKNELKKRYQIQFNTIAEKGLTPYIFITHRGYTPQGVNVSPDGKKIVYSLVHPEYLPGLRLWEGNESNEQLIVKGTIIGRPAFSKDGTRIVYSKVARERYSSWCDLYQYDFRTRKEKRLTHNARVFSPVYRKDSILFLQRNLSPEGIFTLDPDSGCIEPFLLFDSDFKPIEMTINSRGDQIALSGWHNGYLDLMIIDSNMKTIHYLTSDRFADLSPSFSQDGEYLLFSSDRSGIYNLYAYHLRSRQFFQMTNVITGIFDPVMTNDDIYAIVYHENGFDIVVLKINQSEWEKIEMITESTPPLYQPLLQNVTYTDEPYRPMKHLFPRYWVPLLFGAATSARDFLGFHFYSLSYQNQFNGDYSVSFSYQGLFMDPELNIWATADQDKFQYSLSLSYPFTLSEDTELTLSTGYERLYRDDELYPGFWNGFYASCGLSFTGGNDCWLNSQSFNLTYRNGSYQNLPAQKSIFSWSTNYFRAGNTDHFWYALLALGYSTLPQDYTLGGRKTYWSVAGYPEDTLRGHIASRFELGYHFPVMTINQPLFSMGLLKTLYGKIYWVEAGAGDAIDDIDWIGSIGAELHLQSYLADGIPIDLTLGYAQPLQTYRPGEFYLTLGAKFR